jgi:competence ComEA-like helix-hairpin-helix protein
MHVMKRVWTTIRTAAAALLVLMAITLVATAARAQDPADDQASSGAFQRVCSSCHDSQRILATRRTRTQWEEIIGKMIERGALGTDEDFTAAEEYLMKVSGRVNVNRAAPADIAKVLGIPEKQAGAIVDYRKANGDFADFDALCKVPGLDVEKLKAEQEAISF